MKQIKILLAGFAAMAISFVFNVRMNFSNTANAKSQSKLNEINS